MRCGIIYVEIVGNAKFRYALIRGRRKRSSRITSIVFTTKIVGGVVEYDRIRPKSLVKLHP